MRKRLGLVLACIMAVSLFNVPFMAVAEDSSKEQIEQELEKCRTYKDKLGITTFVNVSNKVPLNKLNICGKEIEFNDGITLKEFLDETGLQMESTECVSKDTGDGITNSWYSIFVDTVVQERTGVKINITRSIYVTLTLDGKLVDVEELDPSLYDKYCIEKLQSPLTSHLKSDDDTIKLVDFPCTFNGLNANMKREDVENILKSDGTITFDASDNIVTPVSLMGSIGATDDQILNWIKSVRYGDSAKELKESSYQCVYKNESTTITVQYDDGKVASAIIYVTKNIPGDANDDGEYDIMDIIRMQKYILGASSSINWEVCDVNNDGEYDVFDLGLMHHHLIQDR